MELKPGYKETKVGVIPEAWKESSVGEMGEVVTGKALAVHAPGKLRPYLRTKNVFDGRIDIDDVLTMPMTDEQFAHFRVQRGDVLLNEGQSLDFLHYFCGDASNPQALNETEALRITFYKAVATFVRAYADIAQNLTEAGYSDTEASALKKDVEFYGDTRNAIKRHSGEELDIKPYEADMRHLLNTYVQADSAEDLGSLNALSLTDLIINTGIHDAIAKKLNEKGKLTRNAIAEGIINNVRKTIIREQLTDPKFYEEMSKLLEDLIKQRRQDAATYEQFLKDAEALVRRLGQKHSVSGVPAVLYGHPEAIVLYRNLPSGPGENADEQEQLAALALKIDHTMREKAPSGWKGDPSPIGQAPRRAS